MSQALLTSKYQPPVMSAPCHQLSCSCHRPWFWKVQNLWFLSLHMQYHWLEECYLDKGRKQPLEYTFSKNKIALSPALHKDKGPTVSCTRCFNSQNSELQRQLRDHQVLELICPSWMTQWPHIAWSLQILSPVSQMSFKPRLFWPLPKGPLEGQVKKED